MTLHDELSEFQKIFDYRKNETDSNHDLRFSSSSASLDTGMCIPFPVIMFSFLNGCFDGWLNQLDLLMLDSNEVEMIIKTKTIRIHNTIGGLELKFQISKLVCFQFYDLEIGCCQLEFDRINTRILSRDEKKECSTCQIQACSTLLLNQ